LRLVVLWLLLLLLFKVGRGQCQSWRSRLASNLFLRASVSGLRTEVTVVGLLSSSGGGTSSEVWHEFGTGAERVDSGSLLGSSWAWRFGVCWQSSSKRGLLIKVGDGSDLLIFWLSVCLLHPPLLLSSVKEGCKREQHQQDCNSTTHKSGRRGTRHSLCFRAFCWSRDTRSGCGGRSQGIDEGLGS